MSQFTTQERDAAPIHGSPRDTLTERIDQPYLYFLASRDLRSDEPAQRRPAITALLGLAMQGTGTVRARARKLLENEFGPYVATHGLIGCAAPLSLACNCNDEGPSCATCPWQWSNEA